MAKAILEFNLPDEEEAHKHALNAWSYLRVLEEYDNYLRNRLKYEELPNEVSTALQNARDELYNLCNNEDVRLHG